SRAEIEEATALFRRRTAISRADWPCSSREEFAIGVYQLELRDATRKAFARRNARFPRVPAEYDRDTALGKAAIPTLRNPLGGVASGHEQEGYDVGGGVGVIVDVKLAREEWDGFNVEDYSMPTFGPADQDLCARILAKLPDKKRGRPPIGGQAMSDKE